MKQSIFKLIFIALIAMLLIQCYNSPKNETVKFLASDPFKNTLVQSQLFNINGKDDIVLEGENGTVMVCPKGCFLNSKGDIVVDNVQIELSEALYLADMLLSNLTTSSNGNQLETDGMIYFNATSNGEQLSINKEIPIYFEIPTAKKKAGMMAYKGSRDENGDMNWVDPKVLENFLITVDIQTLDFLPDGFQNEVESGMPFKSYKTTTSALTDSLYYSLSSSGYVNYTNGFVSTDLSEPRMQHVYDSTSEDAIYGIDPAIIKVIKSDKYQNTFIATRAFETRLQTIFKTCDNAVLETYINNLDMNLYKVDSLASVLTKWKSCHLEFDEFYQQRLTKVKEADKHAALLKGYYEKQLTKVKASLEKTKEKLIKELEKKNAEAKQLETEYKMLLQKREKYRTETYGFTWTETGWINIDRGVEPKNWKQDVQVKVLVENNQEFDRVHTYLVFTSNKSLFRLNSTDNKLFQVGASDQEGMITPKNGTALLISIGYKAENPFLAIKEIDLQMPINYSLTLMQSSIKEIEAAINPFDKYASENSIAADLEFMEKLQDEKNRQIALSIESEFTQRLLAKAHPCCGVSEELLKSEAETRLK